MNTCCNKDCPKTDDRILRQLCEIFYPYGKQGCKKVLKKWLDEEKQVQEIHSEYLKKASD